ncbi:hypothetical protein [Xanthocytophaga agilis]|uniref:Tetratricopeptide repeat protein n=1 Tax=Xanthocytophaga agilis TaxID=3048010 RepID=A0AAE3UIH3_9BACT|nr:hypothetical protein [Xanthocytophaga agilis]MDJ1505381.1 hypothetical protein [Xanthocytophaga agilis]
MKKTFTKLAVLLFISASVYAQKVDLDRASFSYTYRDLPTNPLDQTYKTYSSVIIATSSVKANYSDDQFKSGIAIEGWRRVENNAHVIITANIDDVIIDASEVKERVDISKDKNGKETGRKYYYWLEMQYSFAANAKVADLKGNVIDQKITLADRTSKNSFKSDEFGSYEGAANYFNNNKTSLKSRFIREQTNAALANLSRYLGDRYGYVVRKGTDILWIQDSKKHPEYQTYQDNFKAFKDAMSEMKSDEPVGAIKEKLKGFISYLEEIPTKYAADEKADKKLRYASYYNLAQIYLYLDDPTQTMAYAEKLITNDYDAKDGKTLLKAAQDLQALFEKNKSNSRHFTPESSIAQISEN